MKVVFNSEITLLITDNSSLFLLRESHSDQLEWIHRLVSPPVRVWDRGSVQFHWAIVYLNFSILSHILSKLIINASR